MFFSSIAGNVTVSWKKSRGVFEITVESENSGVKKYITLPNGEEIVTNKKKAAFKCSL